MTKKQRENVLREQLLAQLREIAPPFKMETTWGKRRGWEIQRMKVSRGEMFNRVTWRDGSCRGASKAEVQLWNALPISQRGKN